MTDKELRHLNRSELLQMLITQGEENRRLKQELEEANKKYNVVNYALPTLGLGASRYGHGVMQMRPAASS